MKIHISKEAAAWYIEELNINNGDFVRFFVRYGGCSTVQSGFSLGVSTEEPVDIGAAANLDGITFYIEEKDLWYFDNHDLVINFHSDYEEPVFEYKKMD
ncbi:HesB/YadR/YfhF family protein [Paenibacillus sp. BSR1-1]|uniref:HesB/YadR/YfhF family protein n=1 Tax=Paenibacillus sp. BSR1-1 TaxID=3020845 RepID=UPI0025AEF6CD|nr:HesB/YadR/YfhF family protein [Paenibacillus sp. BSR1-1]MDN3015934.1 HesB/YadR/YfhF family protein [Paenibacillus sp. BSR1-1]